MPSVVIPNVSEKVHCALHLRAAKHGTGIEAEMRNALTSAAKPPGRIRPAPLAAPNRQKGQPDR